jgi:hypothetical protein
MASVANSVLSIFNADNPDLQGWNQYDGDKSLEIPLFLSQYLDKDYKGTTKPNWLRRWVRRGCICSCARLMFAHQGERVWKTRLIGHFRTSGTGF